MSHASIITNNIFHIPRNTKLNRAVMTVIIFGFSAAMHAAGVLFKNRSCSVVLVMFWFWLKGIGIVVEDAVRSYYMYVTLGAQGDAVGMQRVTESDEYKCLDEICRIYVGMVILQLESAKVGFS
jgi:hypothetical protein